MNTDPSHHSEPLPKARQQREPPTLPLPPLWRLVIAGLVILAFLYLMYVTGRQESSTPAQSSIGTDRFL